MQNVSVYDDTAKQIEQICADNDIPEYELLEMLVDGLLESMKNENTKNVFDVL